jgi:hypothetical protein
MSWPGAFVDAGIRGSGDIDDPSALKWGCWFDCSAVWTAVKRSDEELLKLLLASINRWAWV